MKFDKSKPYGEIWGHGRAKYEQDGVLFDAAGVPMEVSKETSKPATKASLAADNKLQVPSYVVPEKVQNAVEFLKNVLAGGKIKRNNIYRDAQSNGHAWDDVQKAAGMLNINKSFHRNEEFWKLTEQEAA